MADYNNTSLKRVHLPIYMMYYIFVLLFLPSIIFIIYCEFSKVYINNIIIAKLLSVFWFLMLFSSYFLFQGIIFEKWNCGTNRFLIIRGNLLVIVGYIIFIIGSIYIIMYSFEGIGLSIGKGMEIQSNPLRYYRIGAIGIIVISIGMFDITYDIIKLSNTIYRRVTHG